jgi:hypothetical protein
VTSMARRSLAGASRYHLRQDDDPGDEAGAVFLLAGCSTQLVTLDSYLAFWRSAPAYDSAECVAGRELNRYAVAAVHASCLNPKTSTRRIATEQAAEHARYQAAIEAEAARIKAQGLRVLDGNAR